MVTDGQPEAGATPEASRPFMFGGTPEPALLPWSWAVDRLTREGSFWIATTRPDGRPHTRPVWAVWLDGLHFSTGSQALRNLVTNPEITVHLDSGAEVVLLEGTAVPLADRATLVAVCEAYTAKYGWPMDPDNLPGPFWTVRPRVAFGWVADQTGRDNSSLFHGTATRWRFSD